MSFRFKFPPKEPPAYPESTVLSFYPYQTLYVVDMSQHWFAGYGLAFAFIAVAALQFLKYQKR